PTTSPLPGSITVNGSILPAACRPSRRVISAPIPSGRGTLVNQSFHSSPSFTASTRPCSWDGDSGTSRTCFPSRVMGLIWLPVLLFIFLPLSFLVCPASVQSAICLLQRAGFHHGSTVRTGVSPRSQSAEYAQDPACWGREKRVL